MSTPIVVTTVTVVTELKPLLFKGQTAEFVQLEKTRECHHCGTTLGKGVTALKVTTATKKKHLSYLFCKVECQRQAYVSKCARRPTYHGSWE